MTTGFDRGQLRWSAVLLAILGLSPVPLALPSGIGVAVIGLVGVAAVLYQSHRATTACPRIALLCKGPDDMADDRLQRESGAHV